MFCTECGAANSAAAKFCHACGFRLTSAPAPTYGPSISEAVAVAPLDSVQFATEENRSPQSRTLLRIGGWCSILWGATIIATAFGKDIQLLPRVGGGVLFIAYGVTLITSHRSAVWLGWLLSGAFGLAVLVAGLIPIQIVFWLLLGCWVAYVQRRYRNQVAGAETVLLQDRRAATKRRWTRGTLFGVGLTALGLVSVGVLRTHLQNREGPNTIALSYIADVHCQRRSLLANRPADLEEECRIRNADLESDFYALFRSESACRGLRISKLEKLPAVTEFGITEYIQAKYILDVDYFSDEADQPPWRWTLNGVKLTGSAPTVLHAVKDICDVVHSNGGQADP
jgi:hypothetical protein